MRVPLEALPSMSKLFLDYIQGSDSACQFYPHRPSLDAVEEFARGCPLIDDAHRNRLADALESQHERWDVDTTSIKKLRSGAVAVVTGQQAGLFTGPMYSILKALTAVKIARELDERGVAAVPVFWIAAEDHDHEEIEWAGILSQDSTLEKVTSPLPNPDRAPVGWLRFGSSLPDAIEECFRLLPPSEFAAQVRTFIEGAYSPEVSPVDAFARMMGGLFEGSGLILADPLSPPLRSIEKDVIAGVARRAEDVRSAVAARTQMIIRAGYSEQVRVGRNFTGFFAYREGSRVSLEPEKDLAGLDLSPNVLLRPVVQDSMFPTVAFVGGPAEVAYMAQASSAYECLGKPVPPVFPRITATLVEPPVARVMKKYDLGIEDVFEGMDQLRTRAVGLTPGVEVFDDVRRRVSDQTQRLRPVMEDVDPTLGGALDNAVQKIMHQVDTLRSRFIKGESRRNEVLERHLNTLSTRLFPERKLQERVVNVTPFLTRYGLNLIPMMDRKLQLDPSVHQVIQL